MARILPSALVSDIRGKVGGTLFQGSNAGLVAKALNTKASPRSIAQSRLKSVNAYVQGAWRSLSASQRETWKQFAAFVKVAQKNNIQRVISGQQLFIRSNVIRLMYGIALLPVPDFSASIVPQVTFEPVDIGGSLFLQASRQIDSSLEFVVCFMTFPVNVTINNPGSRYRLIVFTTTTASLFAIDQEYKAVFGRDAVSPDTLFCKAYSAVLASGLFLPASITKTTL